MTQRGVYFLANDGILDMAIAFLNSFRTYNPSTALCLIPYADDVEQLTSLGSSTTSPSGATSPRCGGATTSAGRFMAARSGSTANWPYGKDPSTGSSTSTATLSCSTASTSRSGISTGSTFSPRTRTYPKSAAGCGKTRYTPLAR